MAEIEMVMPKMGESIMEATVISWLKNEGDTIEADESVLEVATDKVDTEVPSTHSGILSKILVKDGEVVPVGQTIAIITTKTETETDSNGQPAVQAPELTASSIQTKDATEVSSIPLAKAVAGRFYSPLVLNISRQENIPMSELESVPGTGKEGRVTKKDILSYVKGRTGAPAAQDIEPKPVASETIVVTPPTSSVPKTSISLVSGDEIIEMDRMRKIISERMVESKHTSAHVTSFVEADVTNIVNWRNKVKNEFQSRENEKLTYTPIFLEAVIQAIKDFPMINISVDGDKIIKHKNINIGIAVALPTGNLIVPVIHNADQFNLVGLAKKVNDLASRARENKLVPDELSGGTFSLTNVGSFGNIMGTPIIMQPQVAILAVGAITKKPAVIETPEGDLIGIRQKMFLSHSYDHRVVDGALGGMFVRKVADYLEAFDTNREF